MNKSSQSVGVIGLGTMGGAIARHLVAAGHDLHGLDIDTVAMRRAQQDGVAASHSIAALCDAAATIILSLDSAAAAHAVAVAIAEAGKGNLVIDTSTLALEDKHALAAILAAAGSVLLDCPISGTGAQMAARDAVAYASGPAEGVAAAMPLLEEWGVPSRLATLAGYAGCYAGYVTDLASEWLGSLAPDQLQEVEIFSCGPTPMLKAVAKVAQRFGVPCQVSLEEYMACAVGGCAGCAVRVETPNGPAMKRVCVDGPVFEASSVFPPAA